MEIAGGEVGNPIWEAERFTREIKLTNRSTSPIIITGFENSCSCLSIEPPGPLTLAAGETKSVTITLGGLIRERVVLGVDGVFREAVTMTPVFTVGESPDLKRLPLEIHYAIRASVRVSPAKLDFGTMSDRATPEAKCARVQLFDGIADVKVQANADVSVSIERDSATNLILHVFPLRTSTPRTLATVLQLIPMDAGGSKMPAKNVPVVGVIKPDIQAEPASVLFGRAAIGESVEDVFRLVSLTQRPFTIVEVSSSDVNAAVALVPPSESVFGVRLTARHVGEHDFVVSVRVRQDSGVETVVRIPVRYRGEPRVKGGDR